MADNVGVLGSTSNTTVATHTVYTCPANKAAKFKLMFRCTAGSNTTVDVIVNGIIVASSGAMTSGHFWYTNGGAGLAVAPGATAPTGQSAAATVQPSAPIFFLSAGQTVQITVGTAALSASSFQVVGVEIDLTA